MMTFAKSISIVMIVGLLAPSLLVAQHTKVNLSKADSLYKAGQRKKARTLYEKAAKEGSADAHFALAYKYLLSREQRIYHYAAAAKRGHAEALENVLDELFFRVSSLTETYPQRGLNLYYKAKKANPNLHIYDEMATVKIMKMAAVTKDFDEQQFIKKYGLKLKPTPYYIWQLAEKASRPGGTFGKPDPWLVLALAVRGGFAPAEKMGAIESVYRNYEKGIVKPFNICDYITSGYGMGFCASQTNGADKKERLSMLDSLKQVAGSTAAPFLQQAYDAAVQFIEAKAGREERHGGSGRTAWVIQSTIKQKHAFLSLMDSVQHGFTPQLSQSFIEADRRLNQKYQKALHVLGKDDRPFQYFTNPKDLRAVQRLWISFRDAAAAAFHRMSPEANMSVWKAWLTERRISQLQQIPGME